MNIKNFHQSPEEIINAATPEQRIMWNHIYLIAGEKFSLSQLYFAGTIATAEMTTYRARRFYFALQMIFFRANNSSVPGDRIDVYDENNASLSAFDNQMTYWNATTAAAVSNANHFSINNLIFGRIVGGVEWTHFQFIGYRIIY